MRRRWIERVLWALVLACAAWGRMRWAHAIPSAPTGQVPVIGAVSAPELTSLALRLRQADSAIARNPFRLDRTPAPVSPQTELPGAPPLPPPFRPPLAISGIVGPPWAAVLEGVPEHDNGVVVRGGERFGDLRIRSVSPAAVVVSSPDTTWRLTVRRWQ